MKLLNKETDYAIRALIVLAGNKEIFISAKEISEKQNIPHRFLRAILQKLIQTNLIESKEGKSGGVRINKEPNKITILDVINIFQGDLELSECMFRKKICPNRKTCVLRPELQRIANTVSEEFKQLTIAKLLKKLGGKNL